MAIIQFPQQKTSPSFSNSFGAGVGEGLGEGIGSLIDMKLERMKKQQTIDRLSDSFKGLVQQGIISEEEAPMLANMAVDAPQAADMYLKDKMSQIRNRQFAEDQNRADGVRVLQDMQAKPEMQPQGIEDQQQLAQKPIASFKASPFLTPEKNVERKKEYDKANEARLKEQRANVSKAISGQKEAMKKINAEAEVAKSELSTSKKIEKLIERGVRKGDFGAPLKHAALKRLYLDYDPSKSKTEIEIEQAVEALALNASKLSGGKTAKPILDAYRRKFPRITQTPEEMAATNKNIKHLARIPILRKKIAGDIIAEGDVDAINNLEAEIDKRIAPYQEKIMNKISKEEELDVEEAKKKIKPDEMSEKESDNEGFGEYIGRQASRSSARAAESIVGFPGDLMSAGKSLANYAAKKITGKDIDIKGSGIFPGLSLFMKGANALVSGLTDGAVKLPTEVSLPTSKDVKKIIKDVSGILELPKDKGKSAKSLTPQNLKEEYFDNVISDVAPLFMFPGAGGITGNIVRRGLKVAGLANIAPLLAKNLKIGEKGQAIAKVGSILALSLGNLKSMQRIITSTVAKNANLSRDVYQQTIKNMSTLGRSMFDPTKLDVEKVLLNEFNNASKIRNFLGANVSMSGRSPQVKTFLSGLLGGPRSMAGKVIKGAFKPFIKLGSVEANVKMLSRYKELRKPYFDMLQAAAKQDSRLLLKNVNKIEKIIDSKAKKRSKVKSEITKKASKKKTSLVSALGEISESEKLLDYNKSSNLGAQGRFLRTISRGVS